MKKNGILNRDLASVLARLGHTDTIIIAGCGLPVPREVPCIDLSLKIGTPSFLTVLRAVSEDMMIEDMIYAKEILESNNTLHEQVINQYEEIPKKYITHEELKERTLNAKAVIRTGEATPYANVILKAGVIF